MSGAHRRVCLEDQAWNPIPRLLTSTDAQNRAFDPRPDSIR